VNVSRINKSQDGSYC